MKNLSRIFKNGNYFKILFIIFDSLFISINWFLAYFLRQELSGIFGYPLNPIKNYISMLPIVLILWVSANSYFGLYKIKKDTTGFEEIQGVLKSVFLGILIMSAISFFLKELDIGRSVIILNSILNLLAFSTVRWMLRKFQNYLLSMGYGRVKCIIVGAGITGIRALQKISDHPEIGYEVVGFLDDGVEKGKCIGKIPVLGKIDELKEFVDKMNVEEIVIAIPSLPQEKILNLVAELSDKEVRFRVISNIFEVLSRESKVDVLEEFPIFNLGTGNPGKAYYLAKRIFDIGVSLLLLILTLPLWAIISILIKIDSPGPVFFIHERVGYKGKRFEMYKFRTMKCDVNPYEESPRTPGDPRLTKIGKFLRKTSLDELPQLLNVLKGDMSLVGPRPEMPFIVEKYNEWQKMRLNAIPGITGLWQILGRKDIPLHENLEYDFYYIKNRSFLFDLVILLKTIPAVLKGKGAY